MSVDRVAGDGGGGGGGGASRAKWRVTDSEGTSEVCVWRMRWSDMHACLDVFTCVNVVCFQTKGDFFHAFIGSLIRDHSLLHSLIHSPRHPSTHLLTH